MYVNRAKDMALEHNPWSTPLSGCCLSCHMTLLQCVCLLSSSEGQEGLERSPLNGQVGAMGVLLTHRVRWLNPTVLNVNALARSRT